MSNKKGSSRGPFQPLKSKPELQISPVHARPRQSHRLISTTSLLRLRFWNPSLLLLFLHLLPPTFTLSADAWDSRFPTLFTSIHLPWGQSPYLVRTVLSRTLPALTLWQSPATSDSDLDLFKTVISIYIISLFGLLHWLPIVLSMTFEILTMTLRALHGPACLLPLHCPLSLLTPFHGPGHYSVCF